MGSDQATVERLAGCVANLLQAGDAVLLSGPLGAGKSTFARALIRAACNDPRLDVPSPSYTLIQTYETPRGPIHHFDLWRLAGPDALLDLGWEDARNGAVLVEWPDRLGALTPANALTITFAVESETLRRIALTGWPKRLHAAGILS